MKHDHICRRILVFAVGLLVISLSIGFITKASLGTPPISSIPYSLSLIFPSLSLGNFTIIYSLLLVFLQLVILGKQADKVSLGLQVVISFVFGYFIDFGMMLLGDFSPEIYWERIVCILIGCFGLAFGVYLQIVADFTMVPGDGFAYALSVRIKKKPYRVVRVCSDVSMIVIAAIIGYIGMGTTGGVREGTVICALLIGTIAGVYFSKLAWLTKRLFPDNPENAAISGSGSDGAGTGN
mgnify:CR=1 FL=1